MTSNEIVIFGKRHASPECNTERLPHPKCIQNLSNSVFLWSPVKSIDVCVLFFYSWWKWYR